MKKLLTFTLLLPFVASAEMGHDMPHMDTMHHDMTEMHHAEPAMMEMTDMTHKMLMPTLEPMESHHTMESHGMDMMMPTITANMPISTQKFLQANHDMHMGMDIEFTGTTDIDFLRGMIPHHQGAVDMANIVLEHGRNGNVKNLARRIINAQEREMRLMTLWLNRIETSHGLHIHENAPPTAEFKMQNMVMHEDMNIKFTGNADIDFVRGMIPHHQGAVEMARTVLRYGKDANVRRFAAEVITEQQREIREMQRFLRRLELRKAGLLY